MTESIRRWSLSILPGFLLAIAAQAEAGPLITVQFAGVANPGYSGVLSGYFQYDQAKTGSAGTFDFMNSGFHHRIAYSAGGLFGNGANNNCDPFVITTTGNNGTTFQLQARTPATTYITIVLPTNYILYNGTTIVGLPNCTVFSNPPLVGSTFTLTNQLGATIYEGTITWISCSQTYTVELSYACAPAVAPLHHGHRRIFACLPRQGCSSGFFHRRSATTCGR